MKPRPRDPAPFALELDSGPRGVRALYFRFSERAVAETREAEVPDVFVDLDRRGRLVGIEMINPGASSIRRALRAVGRRHRIPDAELLRPAGVEKLEALVAAR